MEPREERYEPAGPKPPDTGLFGRVNNYVLLIYAVACFFMYTSVAGLLYLRGNEALSLSLPGIVAFLVPLYILTRRFTLGFSREFLIEAPDLPTTLLAVVAAACAILPADMLTTLLEQRRPPDENYIKFLIAIKPKGLWSLLLVGAGTVVIGPFTEELVFRGFVQRIFHRNMEGWLAVILASIVFGLAHFSPTLLPGAAFAGLVFGYFFWRTGNLVYPIVGHAVYNLSSLLRLVGASEADLRAAEYALPPVLWTAVSLLGLAAVFWIVEGRRHAHALERTPAPEKETDERDPEK